MSKPKTKNDNFYPKAHGDSLSLVTTHLVQSTLWTVFRYAAIGGLENETGIYSPEQVAGLFDQLTNLVKTVHNQRSYNITTNREGDHHA